MLLCLVYMLHGLLGILSLGYAGVLASLDGKCRVSDPEVGNSLERDNYLINDRRPPRKGTRIWVISPHLIVRSTGGNVGSLGRLDRVRSHNWELAWRVPHSSHLCLLIWPAIGPKHLLGTLPKGDTGGFRTWPVCFDTNHAHSLRLMNKQVRSIGSCYILVN